MNFFEYPSGCQAVHILLGIRKRGNNFFRVVAVNPALERKNTFITDPELNRLTHRHAERRHLSHHLKLGFFSVIFRNIRNTEKIPVTVLVGHTVFFIP